MFLTKLHCLKTIKHRNSKKRPSLKKVIGQSSVFKHVNEKKTMQEKRVVEKGLEATE